MAFDIPDDLFRQPKSTAAEQGITLREPVTGAPAEKIQRKSGNGKPWIKSFGRLRDLRQETQRINRVIDEEFGQIEPEEWR